VTVGVERAPAATMPVARSGACGGRYIETTKTTPCTVAMSLSHIVFPNRRVGHW